MGAVPDPAAEDAAVVAALPAGLALPAAGAFVDGVLAAGPGGADDDGGGRVLVPAAEGGLAAGRAAPRGTGHEQQGRRYGVIVQADELLPRSVVLVAPTSHSARAASFRPEIDLLGEVTRVLVEQVGAVDASRLGDLAGRVSPEQQWGIDEALLTVLGLR